MDDRPHSLGWRIRDAAQTWIPLVVVIGDRDDEAEAVEVRDREGQRVRMAPSQLVRLVLDGVSGFPQTPLPRRSTRERFWIR
jgi:threonyl-tRNA synthetase